MAFPPANSQRELANRKILEDLQLQKKQLLLKQGVQTATNNSVTVAIGTLTPPVIVGIPQGVIPSDAATLTTAQRTALHSAHSQSFGYFITQDKQHIQELAVFQKPKILLEQYPTPPHLASHMLHVMQANYGDINGKAVGDLGCGCGVLTIGASLLEAAISIGFDVDMDALDILLDNVQEHELTNIDAVNINILENFPDRWQGFFDTIIMNPPFGTKHNSGIDMKFLKVAFNLATTAVYSLHKTSTRRHVLKVAKECGVKAEVLAELHYNLPNTYKFHKRTNVDIDVDFYRFEITNR